MTCPLLSEPVFINSVNPNNCFVLHKYPEFPLAVALALKGIWVQKLQVAWEMEHTVPSEQKNPKL